MEKKGGGGLVKQHFYTSIFIPSNSLKKQASLMKVTGWRPPKLHVPVNLIVKVGT